MTIIFNDNAICEDKSYMTRKYFSRVPIWFYFQLKRIINRLSRFTSTESHEAQSNSLSGNSGHWFVCHLAAVCVTALLHLYRKRAALNACITGSSRRIIPRKLLEQLVTSIKNSSNHQCTYMYDVSHRTEI